LQTGGFDRIRAPAKARARHQAVFIRKELQGRGEAGAEPPCAELRHTLKNGLDVTRPQGSAAELIEQGLLAEPIGEFVPNPWRRKKDRKRGAFV
jgi:hypothetical protein